MSIQSAIFKGKDSEELLTAFFNGKNLYFIVELPLAEDESPQKANLLGEEILSHPLESLSDFEHAIGESFKKMNLPAAITFSGGFVKENILYLKTLGEGRVYLQRGGELAQLIGGEKSASGYVENEDVVIFTTTPFVEYYSQDELKKELSHSDIDSMVKKLNVQIPEDKQELLIAYFIHFKSHVTTHEVAPAVVPNIEPPVSHASLDSYLDTNTSLSKPSFLSSLKDQWSKTYERLHPADEAGKKKIITIAAVGLISVVLIWSVLLGYQRRKDSQNTKVIQAARELIDQKLTQSEEVSFLNAARSQALIAEARAELERVKTEVGDNNKQQIAELEQLIRDKEGSVIKKEEKAAEEFFDLTIDNPKAQGAKFGYQGEESAIIDPVNNTLYILSLSKKSLEKKSSSKIGGAKIASVYNGVPFYYVPGDGVYTYEDKEKKVIEKDDEWDSIVDMAMYNGNIYLLDAGNKQIYKYVPTDAGYSGKNSYSQGSLADSINADSTLAIDSSLYVSFDSAIAKYTSGVRESFSTEFPEEVDSITKVVTGKDESNVYVWNKSHSVIYILGKNGAYERQVKSSILGKANDVVVYQNTAYVLLKEKIFSINLE